MKNVIVSSKCRCTLLLPLCRVHLLFTLWPAINFVSLGIRFYLGHHTFFITLIISSKINEFPFKIRLLFPIASFDLIIDASATKHQQEDV